MKGADLTKKSARAMCACVPRVSEGTDCREAAPLHTRVARSLFNTPPPPLDCLTVFLPSPALALFLLRRVHSGRIHIRNTSAAPPAVFLCVVSLALALSSSSSY